MTAGSNSGGGSRGRKFLAVLAAVTLAATGCGADDDGGGDGNTSGGKRNLSFAVVTHGAAGDAFWDVVKNGVEQGGKDMGVKVTYQGSGKPQEQADLINAAVSNKVDGLVVSMANPDALKEAVDKAVKAGIPVITINSGQDKSKEFGALTHVGQDETVAGQGAGEQLAGAGVKHVLCVIHEAGNIGLDQRCNGARDTLGGGKLTTLQVDINNMAEAQNTIAAKLQADPSIDGVLALNPGVGIAAVDGAAKANSKAKVATFDLSGEVVEAIIGGSIIFAVDQQQYLQGYLPITYLTLYAENNNTVGGGKPVLTGPGFVTKENAQKVKDLAEAGTR